MRYAIAGLLIARQTTILLPKTKDLLLLGTGDFVQAGQPSAGGSSGLRRPGVLDAEAKGWRERPKYRLVRTALFDQLILSFDFAYDNGVAGLAGTKGLKKMLVAQYDEDLHSAAMEMVKLALILQSRYLA